METNENTNTKAQSRKWLLTLNNPCEKQVTFDVVANILKDLRSVQYYCMSSEIGEQGTEHYHLFIYGKSAIRFSTLKKRFEKWHIDNCRGSISQCISYVKKTNKWEKSKKGDTATGDILEYGTPPTEDENKCRGKRNDLELLLAEIQAQKTDLEIITSNPKYIRYLSYIERVRQTVLYEKAKTEIREVKCYYITGQSGVGKSKFIYDTFGSKAYRVTDYKAPFDGYNGEDVLVLEEFDSTVWGGGLRDFLTICDIYPLSLHCRYSNKWACYTKVFILSNLPLEKQFADVRENGDISTYRAFRRRIHHSYEFIGNGEYVDTSNPLVRYKISDLSKKFG